MKKAMVLATALALIACNKESSSAPAADDPQPAAKPAAAAQPTAAPTPVRAPSAPKKASVDPASLLTPEKIKGLVTYNREIAQVAGDAVGMAGKAMVKAKGDQEKMQKEMARDERRKRVAAASTAALEKSGLTYPEIAALSNLLSGYYAKRMMAVDAAEALKKQSKGVFAEMHKKQIEEGDAARAEMEKKHGKEAMAAIDANEKDFIEVQKAMMSAVFKRKKK